MKWESRGMVLKGYFCFDDCILLLLYFSQNLIILPQIYLQQIDTTLNYPKLCTLISSNKSTVVTIYPTSVDVYMTKCPQTIHSFSHIHTLRPNIHPSLLVGYVKLEYMCPKAYVTKKKRV